MGLVMKQIWGCVLGILLAGFGAQAHADSDALWRIIDTRCVPHQVQQGSPAPCALVDLAQGRERGYVVLKDLEGPLQYLVMPTAKITGIESPAFLASNAPDYWGEAWDARHFMDEKLGREIPRELVSLAVNSTYGRSQNQAHIHVSCVDPVVYQQVEVLKDLVPAGQWKALPVKLSGNRYLARRVDAAAGDYVGVNPFRLIAGGIPGARGDMGRYSLGMLATRFGDGRDGFILLVTRADLLSANRGHAEELQDHDCRVLGLPMK